MATVNRVLRENGQREHVEPRVLPDLSSRAPINGYPYSFIHFLRRVAALRRSNPEFVATPLADGQEPDDPAVEREYAEIRSHLICHSDAEGFYVPIDFSDVLFDDSKNELTGAMLGSSQQLLRELVHVAPALGIRLDDGELSDSVADQLTADIDTEQGLWIEKAVWIDFYESARLSVKHGTTIIFN